MAEPHVIPYVEKTFPEPLSNVERLLTAIIEGVNKVAQNTESALLEVHYSLDSDNNMVLDKTWQEIHDAPFAVMTITSDSATKKTVFGLSAVDETGDNPVYWTVISGFDVDISFSTNSADGYPVEYVESEP